MGKKTAKTNAMRICDAAGIAYRVREYVCDGVNFDGEEVAKQVGLAPEKVFKTLVLRDDKNALLVCCIPVHCHLNRKALAQAAGVKAVDMIQVKELQGLTGYVRGGCSPIGMKKALPTFIDESALAQDEVAVSAGQRGMQMLLDPCALIQQTRAQIGEFVSAKGD